MNSPSRSLTLAALVLLVSGLSGAPLSATCHVHSPLILDLDGGGIETTGRTWAVSFDIDADGEAEKLAWTYWGTEEAFLWLDRNANGAVDDGSELFGDATPLPGGAVAENGFEALAVYDRTTLGGNVDGLISRADQVFRDLRLWVDRNHNGQSERDEILGLARAGVVALGLAYVETNELDGNANLHRFQGFYVKKQVGPGGVTFLPRAMDDVFFLLVNPGHLTGGR